MVLTSLLVTLAFAAHPHPKGLKKKTVEVPLVESVFRASAAPVSRRAKIFLVAGSSLAASFAREIIDQKALWLGAGFHEDEIECYYVVPLQEDFNGDPKLFRELAAAVAGCHPANAKLLRQHLRETAARKPPFLYLYVTSHGDKPSPQTLAEARKTDDDYWALTRESRYPVLDQYTMLVEGLPDGTATGAEIFGAYRGGMDPADLYLTPRYLREALAAGFEKVPKFVVLQGCFSGGFVEEEEDHYRADLLTRLPELTVLTAARHDRSSFGCEPGSRTTFYGGAYNEALARFIRPDPRAIDWRKLHETVAAHVVALEKREKAKPPSLPQFFTSAPPSPARSE
ncbi:MAG: hypothetical protein HY075_14150 [Deltaproteobacteria bacterium]|nr:hypothetical protein [Deltaproteobacteria bacterium]